MAIRDTLGKARLKVQEHKTTSGGGGLNGNASRQGWSSGDGNGGGRAFVNGGLGGAAVCPIGGCGTAINGLF